MSIIFKGRMPLPPGINQSYKIITLRSRRGMVHTLGPTEALETFKYGANIMLRLQGTQDKDAIEHIQLATRKTPLAVLIRFYFPTLWLRDVDGGIKAAMDATFAYLCLNDNMVVRVAAEKRVDRKDPRCEIEVSIVSQEVA